MGECEKLANEGKDDPGKQRKLFNGIVLVVLKKPSDCYTVLQNQKSYIRFKLTKILCCCNKKKTSNWYFERAPEPSDIFWENLDVSTTSRVCKGLFSYLVTVLMIFICFAIVLAVK